MRLIDADALKPDYIAPSTSTGTVNTQYVSLYQILNAPTADVVEVVMCRNCKKWEQNKNLPYGNCSYHLSLAYATDWCSWAERREDV